MQAEPGSQAMPAQHRKTGDSLGSQSPIVDANAPSFSTIGDRRAT
jgi:hypothetical protein